MNRIKLTDAGSAVVRRIDKVEINTAGKWPDYELFSGDDVVVIPKNAADRQIARAGKSSVLELAGQWVKVSRSDEPGDNGKLFWNLAIVPEPKDTPKSGRIPEGTGRGEKVQPFDLPSRAEAMDNAMSEIEGDYPESWDEVEQPKVAPTADKLMALATRYAGLFKVMDGKLKDAYGTKVPPDVVQACVATVFIEANKRNLV